MGAAAAPRRAPAPRHPARNRVNAPKRRKTKPRASSASRRSAQNRVNGTRTQQTRRPKLVRAEGRSARARIAPNGFAQPALAGAALIPHAAVHAAGAVRDLSDSSLIMRLTRGRGWIAVLCALLVGIVTLNVISLSLNAGSGRLGQQIAEFEQANSGLRAELAEELSSARIAQLAPAEGYGAPPAEAITYLTVEDDHLAKLLRLFSNDMVLARAAPVISTTATVDTSYAEPTTSTATATDSTETTDTTATEPAPSEPVTSTSPAPTAATPAPSTPVPAPTSSGGGIGAGL